MQGLFSKNNRFQSTIHRLVENIQDHLQQRIGIDLILCVLLRAHNRCAGHVDDIALEVHPARLLRQIDHHGGVDVRRDIAPNIVIERQHARRVLLDLREHLVHEREHDHG